MKRMILIASMALIAPTKAGAQDTAFAAGQSVRAETANGHRIKGRLLAWDKDSITLDVPSSATPVVFGRSSIVRLETGCRGRSQAVKGAAIGALAGLAASAIVGEIITSRDGYDDGEFRPGAGAVLGAFYLGRFAIPLGALVGAGIGHRVRSEKWQVVGIGNEHLRMEMSSAQTPGRNVAARVSFSW
ncbi:MAG: hypothetical protein ABI672_02875 [Vicinamibacteria bacterium]